MSSGAQPPALLVIGDVMLDVIAAPHGPIESGTDTPAAIALLPGGSGANVAAWLGHFGNTVFFAGRAGSESHAWHAAALRDHGVEPVLARDAALRTGVLVNLISSDGERSFLTDRGANAGLLRADLPDTLLDRVGLVHVSGYALSTSATRSAVLNFLAVAQARCIPITIDPGSVSILRAVGPASFLRWTSIARICFPNAAEAGILAATTDEDEALATLATSYETVVIKLGRRGAVASTQHGRERHTAAAPQASARDTTGAGDAFVAGFLSAYIRDCDIATCLRAAVGAGTSAVGAYGGRPPLALMSPDMDD